MPPRDITGKSSAWDEFKRKAHLTYQRYLDKTVPHRAMRWAMFGFLLMFYIIRVFFHGGFYVITYGMGIHLLYLLLLLVTPLAEDEFAEDSPLPRTAAGNDGEFRPFVPRVQEFVVWKSMFRVVSICLFLTLFNFLDIPVFWPILLLYFIVLTVTQMGSRIKHMMKHRYVPWNAGKPKYVAKATT
ncbi:putative endoplasmatic reticulum retrieval protein [Trypanosoma cruzi]|uniref:Protein RER1 n=2 Tax=Trypanosoma cruzi TaxID=5693 RepID=Q4CLA0_TRYCC|nr:endoplasmatic reticulum retrieval protein, putative [Trypanosoma cruzi]PBJ71094.1 endoplasmatic reticulum retrieval protein [Trypanosoma cruzi cruzi]EAN81051.1 endoplasmatic reticulum retrieval protein, putative [Trypanosoma cruzi]KAF8280703.1 putative endoplasmatic reticulum retrieval protein [Trypanosoma cruzi]PWU88311.1 putative endoplasmatic reticulum retrieval protein [Trypanosoma cruzi]PWV09019.1 putative endoplasmatic reticulum retrieval protein [Trypanosoma cruzi]|eukprot:XP_802497.1 endoplasmatic reticulum retrieval protein [Trypanosoma cruzi strain CL Brener]